MSCSEAISSSSGGVTDVLSDCGRAMVLDHASFFRRSAGDRGESNFPIDFRREIKLEASKHLPVTFKIGWHYQALNPLAKTSSWMRDLCSRSALYGTSLRHTTSSLKSSPN
jgi:hypothetical protein